MARRSTSASRARGPGGPSADRSRPSGSIQWAMVRPCASKSVIAARMLCLLQSPRSACLAIFPPIWCSSGASTPKRRILVISGITSRMPLGRRRCGTWIDPMIGLSKKDHGRIEALVSLSVSRREVRTGRPMLYGADSPACRSHLSARTCRVLPISVDQFHKILLRTCNKSHNVVVCMRGACDPAKRASLDRRRGEGPSISRAIRPNLSKSLWILS